MRAPGGDRARNRRTTCRACTHVRTRSLRCEHTKTQNTPPDAGWWPNRSHCSGGLCVLLEEKITSVAEMYTPRMSNFTSNSTNTTDSVIGVWHETQCAYATSLGVTFVLLCEPMFETYDPSRQNSVHGCSKMNLSSESGGLYETLHL